MVDRLLPLLLALSVAAPAATRGPCCCATKAIACFPPTESADAALPPCCRPQEPEPTCCREGAVEGLLPAPCGCEGCLANRPVQPLAVAPTTPDAVSAGEPLDSLLPAQPPIDLRVVAQRHTTPPAAFGNRPPDRLALLCVWII